MLGFVLVLAAMAPPDEASVASPPAAEVEPPRPVLSRWQRQHRRLKIQTGVSWGFVGVGVVGMAGSLGSLVACGRSECCEPLGELVAVPLFAVLTAAALIPAIIYTDRLVEHRPRLHISSGGLALSF